MRNVPGLEAVYHDYKAKGVEFFYVYKALAHPEKDGYVQPVSVAERLLHVKEAKRRLDTKMPWLCDSMSNDLKHGFGDRNNSEFVIGPDGRFAVVRDWSNPKALRKDLEKLVGAVEQPTAIADLDRDPKSKAKAPALRGIVPRVEQPGGMVPIKAVPKLSVKNVMPFYAKLNARAQQEAIAGGKGKILLGFHLDPIYDVHWNNLAAPIKFSIKASDGVEVSPASGTGPEVEQESDIDPREFLIDVEGADPKRPLVLTVDYFACNDAEGWCKAVSQQYEIFLARDPDAGRVMGARGGGKGRRTQGDRPQRGGSADQIIARIFASDTNGDGKISREEAPPRWADRFDQMDADGDGFVDKKEIEARFKQRRSRAPQ